jgi:hypothetical protein
MNQPSACEAASSEIRPNDAHAREADAAGASLAHGSAKPLDERASEAGQGGYPRPARGYTWPPFEPGNEAALRHGAHSLKLVEPRARELAPAILEANAHLDSLRDGHAVMRLAVALARIERVWAWLAEQDDAVFSDTEAGEVHGVHERLSRWERQAAADEDRLGISPVTRAKLGLDLLRGQVLTEEQKRQQAEARKRLDERMGGGNDG